MEWDAKWQDPLTKYLQAFDKFIGDRRTRRTLQETIRGIFRSRQSDLSTDCGAFGVRSLGKKGWQRVARLASGASTQRSDLYQSI